MQDSPNQQHATEHCRITLHEQKIVWQRISCHCATVTVQCYTTVLFHAFNLAFYFYSSSILHDTPIEYPFSALDTAGWRQNWHLAYNNLTPEIPKGSSLRPLRNAASLSDSRKIGQLTKTTSCNISGRCLVMCSSYQTGPSRAQAGDLIQSRFTYLLSSSVLHWLHAARRPNCRNA